MILRGPTLSEQRFALVLKHAPTNARFDSAQIDPYASQASRNVAADSKSMQAMDASDDSKSDDARRNSLYGIESSEIPSLQSLTKHTPQERELAFEQVVAWLAVQDEETRNACAAILASELTQTYETAKAEGFEFGHEAGKAVAVKETKLHSDVLHRLHVAAEKAFTEEQAQMQNICVEIVAEALTKIAGPLLAGEEALVGIVREVLARVKEGREIIVRVAREDLSILRKFEAELAASLSGRKLELLADSRIELGGCIVETKLGSLDGRLEVQLRELYETLRLAKSFTPELV